MHSIDVIDERFKSFTLMVTVDPFTFSNFSILTVRLDVLDFYILLLSH